MEQKNKMPVHQFKIGSIKCAIWENISNGATLHSVTIARLYKDGEQWKQSNRFGHDDLLIVGKVADAAFDWIASDRNRLQEEKRSA